MLALVAGLSAGPARADGDPASDVLATQSLFLPQDAGVPAGQQAQLQALLGEAGRAGYPIRVALVASATDLGSITALWRQPQLYARFLGQELSLVYRGPLVVVMPTGIGVYNAHLSSAPGGSGLAGAAEAVVIRLAADAGHSLATPYAPLSRGRNRSDATPWIAFAIGAALVALAWGLSLRARPLRLSAGGS